MLFRSQSVEFYGVLREVTQLMYNSSVQSHRTVVVLRYDWYNLAGNTKSASIDDDRHFKAINIRSLWYEGEPFIHTTQARNNFLSIGHLLGQRLASHVEVQT